MYTGEQRKRTPLSNEMVAAIVSIVIAVGSAFSNYGVLTWRIDQLEKRYVSEVVPRQEQDIRDKMLSTQIEQMQHSLDLMNKQLADISISLRRR